MKAIRVSKFGDSSVLKVEDLPIPECKDNEVLVKVMAVGVNPVEVYIRSGGFPLLPPLPYTPGGDAAGVIEKVGSAVKEFTAGQRVYTIGSVTGAYASYLTALATDVHILPEGINFEQGAALGIPYYTACRALFIRGGAKKGDSILVHGASGAVGLACCQIGRARGLRVFGTAGTDKGMSLATESGADHVYNHREAGYMQKIKEDSGGIDLVIEMLANENLASDCSVMNKGGRIMVIGSRGESKFDPALLFFQEVDVRGVLNFHNTPADVKSTSKDLGDMMKSGAVKPVIAKSYKLSEAPQCHEDIMNNKGTFGKLVLSITH